MLFKVASFCVRGVHKPIKKHGIDDDDYMGAYDTPFEYKNPNLDTLKKDKRDFGKRLNLDIELDGVVTYE